MKRFSSLLSAILIAGMFCVSAFADDASVQPRAAECPFCGTFGWNTVLIGTSINGKDEVDCEHFPYGYDIITHLVSTYEGSCRNCGQSMTMTSNDDTVECFGRSHI